MNLDAYTVRKIAPRLLLAVIAVNLSIYLCVAAIDITNVVGHGLSQLIKGPFDVGTALNVNIDEGSSNLSAFFILAGAFGATILSVVAISGGATAMIFFVMLPVIMVVLAIIVTIAIRQALLVLLTLISPVAIACLVLPGTEKYFKQWWDLFLKTLLVYPIVAALFAVSDVMASILLNSSNRPGTNNIQGASDIIVGVLLTVLPLFLIPFAFKFSGGAIGAIVNGASSASQPFVRLARRKRQQGLEKGWGKTRGGQMFKGANEGSLRSRINRRAQQMSHLNDIGFNPKNMPARLRNATEASSYNHQQEILKNNPFLRNMMADDDRMWAVKEGKDAKGVSAALAYRGGRYKYRVDENGRVSRTKKDEHGNAVPDYDNIKRYQENQRATQQVMEFRRQVGFDNAQGVGIVALSTSSTGYNGRWVDKKGNEIDHESEEFTKKYGALRTMDSKTGTYKDGLSGDYIQDKTALEGLGAADQYRYQTAAERRDIDIINASGGSLNKATSLMIDSHRAASSAGRDDLAASADAGIGAVTSLIEAQHAQGESFNPNVIEGTAMKDVAKSRDNYDTALAYKKSMAKVANDHELTTKDTAYAYDKNFQRTIERRDHAAAGLKIAEGTGNQQAIAMAQKEYDEKNKLWLGRVAEAMAYQDVAGNAPTASVAHLSPLMNRSYNDKDMIKEIARIRNAATPISTTGLSEPDARAAQEQAARNKADSEYISGLRREYGSESALASVAQQRYMAENAAKMAEQSKTAADDASK